MVDEFDYGYKKEATRIERFEDWFFNTVVNGANVLLSLPGVIGLVLLMFAFLIVLYILGG